MYRQDGRPRDLSVDPADVFAAERRLRKKKLIWLAIAAVFVAGALGGLDMLVTQAAERVTQAAWARAETCIAGAETTPLGAKIRNAQLAAMEVPSDKRLRMNGWPVRCAPALREFALTARPKRLDIAGATEELAASVAGDPAVVTSGLGEVVDRLFTRAAAEDLVLGPAKGFPEPTRASPLPLASIATDAHMLGEPITLKSIHRSPLADDTLRFIVDDTTLRKGPAVCSLAEGARAIACTKVPSPAAEMSPGLRLWGSTAARVNPFVFAGWRGKSGIFRADTGERVVDRLEYGAYGATALDDGSLGYLAWHARPPEIRFVHIAPDGRHAESAVRWRESGNPYYSSSVLWSHVVFRRADGEGIRLFAREIDPSGAMGPEAEIAPLNGEVAQIVGGPGGGEEGEEPYITGCRSGESTVLRAITNGGRDSYLSFFRAGHWTAPVRAPGLGSKLQCRPGEATLSRVWGAPWFGTQVGIDLRVCTVAGCEDRSIGLNEALNGNKDILPRDPASVRVVDIDGKLLLVWLAGEIGGLRYRFGASGELNGVRDTVFFDDHAHEGAFGKKSTLVDFDLLPMAHGAVLLLGTLDGVFAYRFDSSGKTSPVAMSL